MTKLNSLMLAGVAAVSLGMGAAMAQDGPGSGQDYWAARQQASGQRMVADQMARDAAAQTEADHQARAAFAPGTANTTMRNGSAVHAGRPVRAGG